MDIERAHHVRRLSRRRSLSRGALIVAAAASVTLIPSAAFAQIVTFDTSGNTAPQSALTTMDATQQAAGVNGTPQLSRFTLTAGSGAAGCFFNTGANTTNTLDLASSYDTFTVGLNAGSLLFATAINWTSQGSSTAPNNYATAFSTDSFVTSSVMTFTGETQATAKPRNFSIVPVITNETLAVRLYNYGATSIGGGASASGGSFRVITPTVSGTTQSNNTAVALTTDTQLATLTTFTLGLTSGAGGIIKVGAGSVQLGSANTFLGGVTINGGALSISQITDGGVAGSLGKSSNAAANLVISGGTITFTGASASTDRLFTIGTGGATLASANSAGAPVQLTNTGAIAFTGSGTRNLTLRGSKDGSFAAALANGTGGATSLTKADAGRWTLTGASTYTGLTTVSNGTLTVSNIAGTTSNIGGGNVSIGGTTAKFEYTGPTANNVAGRSFSLSSAGEIIISGATTTFDLNRQSASSTTTNLFSGGNNRLTLSGGGTLVLSAANSSTGGVTINGATLKVGADGAAGSSGVSIGANSVLQIDNVAFTANSSTSLTTGVVLNNGGTLRGSGTSALQTGALQIANGTDQVTLATAVASDVFTLAQFIRNANGTTTSSAKITAAGPGRISIIGTTTATNTTSYVGSWALSAGTLELRNSAALGGTGTATARPIELTGGNLDLAGTTTNTSGQNFASAVTVSGNASVISDRLAGSPDANGFYHQLGTLSIGAFTLTETSGANVTAGAAGVAFGATTLTASPTFNVVNQGNVTGSLSLDLISESGGSQSITKTGSGVLILTAGNTFTGRVNILGGTVSAGFFTRLGPTPATATDQTFIDGGTLSITTSSGTPTAPSAANRNFVIGPNSGSGAGTIEIVGSDRVGTINGVIKNNGAGSGRLYKTGTGTLALTANNTQSGGIGVLGGVLSIESGNSTGALPASPVADFLSLDGGVLNFNSSLSVGSLASNRGITIGAGGGAIDINAGKTFLIRSVITGSGAFSKTGLGELALGNVNTYTATNTNLVNGTIRAGIDNALPASTTLVMGSGTNTTTFDLQDNDVASGATPAPAAYNQIVGGIAIAGGATAANSTITNSLAGAGNTRTFTVNNNAANTFGGRFTGNLNLIKSGTADLTLTNANTYTGQTRIANGTLKLSGGANRLPVGTALVLGDPTNTGGTLDLNSQSQTVASIAHSGAAGTGNRVINGGAGTPTFTINNLTATTFAGRLGGGASGNSFEVDKTGAGALTLTGDHTWTGGAIITDGPLVMNGTHTGGGPWLVGSTLAGTGSTNATVDVVSAGHLAPGSASSGSVGTITVETLTLESGANYDVEFDAPASGPVVNDLAVVTRIGGGTTVDVSGAALNLTLVSGGSNGYFTAGAGAEPSRLTYVIVDNRGANPVVGTFQDLAEGATIVSPTLGRSFEISYVGGSGNDITLTSVPEPAVSSTLLLGAAIGAMRRVRRRGASSLRA